VKHVKGMTWNAVQRIDLA